jgi:hypothetical protein
MAMLIFKKRQVTGAFKRGTWLARFLSCKPQSKPGLQMITAILRTSMRALLRHRLITTINIAGLALSVTFCVFAYLFVNHEAKFDAFHTSFDRIVRAHWRSTDNLETRLLPFVRQKLAPEFASSKPSIEAFVRLVSNHGMKPED